MKLEEYPDVSLKKSDDRIIITINSVFEEQAHRRDFQRWGEAVPGLNLATEPLREAQKDYDRAVELCQKDCPLRVIVKGEQIETLLGEEILGSCTGFKPQNLRYLAQAPQAIVTVRTIEESFTDPVEGNCGVVPQEFFEYRPPANQYIQGKLFRF